MKRISAILLCLLYGVIPCDAGAVVLVSQSFRDGAETVTIDGSGAIVKLGNGRLSVISCAHAGADRNKNPRHWDTKRPVRILIDGNPASGRFLKLDSKLDLSLIELDYDGDVDAYPLAAEEPPVRSVVWSGGYVKGRHRGTWKQVMEYNMDHLRLDLPHEHGQSGGPVIHDGRIVGVVQGTYNIYRNGKGSTIRLREVRRFVGCPCGPDCKCGADCRCEVVK